jgi:hypothetical protein
VLDLTKWIAMIAMTSLWTLQASKAHAEMSESDAWNVGSVFAAGTMCEMKGYITQGQTTPLMTLFLLRVPAIDGERIRDGYQQGLKRTAVYSKDHGWVSYPLTADGCSKVQYAITQYKIGFDTVIRNEAQHLTGADRASFVVGVANACLRKYDADKKVNPAIPRPLVEQYCRCYANGLADRASKSELKSEDPTIMDPIIQAARKPCYAEMKEEARKYLGPN